MNGEKISCPFCDALTVKEGDDYLCDNLTCPKYRCCIVSNSSTRRKPADARPPALTGEEIREIKRRAKAHDGAATSSRDIIAVCTLALAGLEDARRLDWLEAHPHGSACRHADKWIVPDYAAKAKNHRGSTLRAAIDAASPPGTGEARR